MVTGAKRTLPAASRLSVRGRSPPSIVTVVGIAAASPGRLTTRSESMVRGSGHVSSSVGRASEDAASQAVSGSPSTARRGAARRVGDGGAARRHPGRAAGRLGEERVEARSGAGTAVSARA